MVKYNIKEKIVLNKRKRKKINDLASDNLQLEKRTLEDLLFDLRKEKNWSYVNIIYELNNLGVFANEKIIRKWELGLEYPSTDILYKFSEIYYLPVENFIMAKNNSYTEGMNSIHKTFIKWFCYFTGLSFKIGYVTFFVVLYGALIFAFLYFIEMCNLFMESRK